MLSQLYNSTFLIYKPLYQEEVYGNTTINYQLCSNDIDCYITYLEGKEQVFDGKENVIGTHRLFCDPVTISTNDRIYVNELGLYFDIRYIDNCDNLGHHLELLLEAVEGPQSITVDNNGTPIVITFDRDRLDSVWTTVNANSAIWSLSGSSGETSLGDIPLLSAFWSEAYTNLVSNSANYLTGVDLGDIPSLSGNWNSVYSTVNSNSAIWDLSGLQIGGFDKNIQFNSNNELSGVDNFTYDHSKQQVSLIGRLDNPELVVLAISAFGEDEALDGISVFSSDGASFISKQDSAQAAQFNSTGNAPLVPSVYIKQYSADGQGIWVEANNNYFTGNINIDGNLVAAGITGLNVTSGINPGHLHTNYLTSIDLGDIPSLSANWNSVYSTVNANSAVNWNYQGTDIKALTGNWENTFTTVQNNSAGWGSDTSQFLTSSSIALTASYAKLDGTNQPFTGNLNISKADPEYRLTDTGNSEYSRWTKSDTTNYAYQYNRVLNVGGIGQALSLNGTTGIIELDTYASSLIFNSPVTISFWFYANNSHIGGSAACLFHACDNVTASSAGGEAIGIWYGDLTGTLTNEVITVLKIVGPTPGTHFTAKGFTDAGTWSGSWHHLVVNITGTAFKIYLDGIDRTLSTPAGWANNNFNYGNDISPKTHVTFGARKHTSMDSFFSGKLDQLAIWNTTLTQANVTSLYNSGLGYYFTSSDPTFGGSSLKLLLHTDDGSGSTATDSSGNTFNGALTGTSWVTGIEPGVPTTQEAVIWSSKDGVNLNERGIQTFGDSNGRTVINGSSIRLNNNTTEVGNISAAGLFLGGSTVALAKLHLGAGTTSAYSAPIKLTSGTSMTVAEVGSIEMTTDDLFFTITTGTARKRLLMADAVGGLTSGKYPKATTNGRLTDGPTPLAGTKVYYVSDSSGGAVTRKLTFTDGILTAET